MKPALTGSRRNMVEWDVLEEVKRNPNVVTLGLFGSWARQKKGFDIDVFALVKDKADEISSKLLEAGFDAAVNRINELNKVDPVFLAAVARSFKPIKGELKLKINDNLIEDELRSAAIYNLIRLREGLTYHEYPGALTLNAFNAAQYACWLLLYKQSLPLPGNSKEMLDFLEEATSTTLLGLFKNSVLAAVKRGLDADKTKFKKPNMLYTVLSVSEALRLTLDPLKEADEWIKHVQERLKGTDPRDIMSIRELCQDLFMAVYNITRGYITAKKGYAPETHSEIFHSLEEMKSLDPHAAKVEEAYKESYHKLHVECHYRGVGSIELVRRSIDKTRELINYVKAVM